VNVAGATGLCHHRGGLVCGTRGWACNECEPEYGTDDREVPAHALSPCSGGRRAEHTPIRVIPVAGQAL